MIDLAVLKGSSFVVLGLARSGLATARALVAAGVGCVAWDDNEVSRAAAHSAGVVLADPASIDWSRTTALVISPGIPSHLPTPHPVAAAARAAGKSIICDVELLARAAPKACFVAITGTNGKSTTTALIGHILDQAGARCELGGNIGRGALDLAPLGEGGVYVLELSSYQLELLETFRPNVAVWLNVTPDHIDRHGDMAGYVAAKENIFARHQRLTAATRAAIKALGLPLFAPDDAASPAITAVAPQGVDAEQIRAVLKKRFDIVMAGGQDHLNGKIFRIGHLGFVGDRDILAAVASLEATLQELGYQGFTPGAGVAAASQVFVKA